MALEAPYAPQDVSDVELVFPASVVDRLMPAMNDIPSEFHMGRTGKWNDVVGQWFFRGLPDDVEFDLVEGIDGDHAFRHLSAVMGSYEPQHQHKEAAVAYLMSLWFTDVRKWKPAAEAVSS